MLAASCEIPAWNAAYVSKNIVHIKIDHITALTFVEVRRNIIMFKHYVDTILQILTLCVHKPFRSLTILIFASLLSTFLFGSEKRSLKPLSMLAVK